MTHKTKNSVTHEVPNRHQKDCFGTLSSIGLWIYFWRDVRMVQPVRWITLRVVW